MDHASPQDAHQSKSSMLRQREHSDEPVDIRPVDSSISPSQEEKRLIRRVRSPSRPRAWLSGSSYKPKFGGRFNRPRDDHSFHKHGYHNHKYHHYPPRGFYHRKEYFQPKPHHSALREHEKEKERYEQRENADGSSLPKQNSASRPFLPRTTSSRDKDTQFSVCHGDRNQSRERDHRGSGSRERERSRDGDLPSTASQTMARDRAIQQKRREIDEVYYQECEMFGLVAKMLIAKDQSLEGPIQSSLQENLRDIGKRCVEAMEKFIEEYDSREPSH
ncbi:periphilin-1 [Labrus bergylta]|uniref:periphilin-1 n=1 Tax=Labrus bergylta TaxID=56723 RepID=UPI003313BC55